MQWYVVLTKPRQEQRAADNLLAQGGTVFLPMLPVERIVRGKRCLVEEVLFPGYLFLQLPADSVLHSKVRSTFGVRGFLRFADQVVTVADAIIEDIRQRITLPASNEVFQPGEAVQFSSGPLKDYQAVFSGYSGEERAIVLISLLGQQNQLLVDLGAVSKV